MVCNILVFKNTMNLITMPRTVLKTGIRVLCVITTLWIINIIDNVGKAEEIPPIFKNISLNSTFTPDPFVTRGISGGSFPGSQIAKKSITPTGPCTGFVDEAPSHTLELTSKFAYLKLLVESPSDTTMIITGPGGTWCNDDFDGKNPGIVGEWLKGTYKIWIGSYSQGKYLPYTLKITEVK
jgi:hypothetical protein